MSQQQQSRVNEVELHRPHCSKCGTGMQLARIEPSDEPNYDLRTFECSACDHSEVVKIRFR